MKKYIIFFVKTPINCITMTSMLTYLLFGQCYDRWDSVCDTRICFVYSLTISIKGT